MAKSKTTDAGTPATKKTRARKPQHFYARLHGSTAPVLVIAKTQKDAHAALLATFREATATDLIDAGKNGYAVIDKTIPASNVTSITEAA